MPDEPIYSATGEVGERLSSEKLTRSLRDRGVPARSLADVDDLARSVASDAREGDVVLVMSNGAFGNIWEKLLPELRSA